MIEITVASLTKNEDKKRKKTAWIVGSFIFLLGIPSALSAGVLSDFTLFGKNIFDTADFLVSNILMPIGALSISLFVHLKIPKDILLEEISAGTNNGKRIFAIWLLFIRYIVPIAIIIVFIDVIGIVDLFNK